MFQLVFITFFVSGACDSNYHETTSRLRKTLLGSYDDVLVRPSNVTNVAVRFNLLNIHRLEWQDGRVCWQPDQYGGLSTVHVTSLEVWTPTVVVQNTVEHMSVLGSEDPAVPLDVTSDGNITWKIPVVHMTYCDVSILTYPFDDQVCDITAIAWEEGLLLHLSSNTIDLGEFLENSEWWITGHHSERRLKTPNTYQTVFTLSLTRKPMFHIVSTLIPVMLLSFASTLVFYVPPDTGEKISYALSMLLSYVLLLSVVSDDIPETSKEVSAMAVYLVVMFTMCTLNVTLATTVTSLYRQDESTPKQRWLMAVILQLCQCRTSREDRHKRGSAEDKDENDSAIGNSNVDVSNQCSREGEMQQMSWKELALRADVIFRRVFMLMMFCFNMSFLVVLILL
ncbi:acetylcholine receptor subunit beta-like [Haliotis rubra]|uniref:acetylcholine receptor subunit beta-like n=1 Tax=Haliotis rubra TaxID=36100 RepID=UPI001EE5C103|nr:acetylcholine receptor subunit beta-like [Haliotis rubra]